MRNAIMNILPYVLSGMAGPQPTIRKFGKREPRSLDDYIGNTHPIPDDVSHKMVDTYAKKQRYRKRARKG